MDATTALIWLLGLPLAASPVIYLAGRISSKTGSKSKVNLSFWLALLAIAATFVPLYYAGQAYLAGGAVALKISGIQMKLDGISLLLAVVVLVLGLMVTIFSSAYNAGDNNEEKYYALLTMMIGSIIGLGCAADLFNLWLWFEAMAISSYMLVAFYQDQPASLEAGVKYLAQSASGSALVIFGIAMVFAQTGTLDLAAIPAAVKGGSPLLIAAGALFVVGFGVKTSLVPLHTWLPDAHSQAPSGISAMLSGVVIEAGLIALLRSVGAISGASHVWGTLILVFGALNMLLGNLMALRQTQVKRLLAYSSVAHVGYMLVGLGAAIAFKQVDGATGAFFHVLTHSFLKGLAFLGAGVFLYSLHIARGNHEPLMVDDLAGAGRRYPLAAFAFSVAVLGLGGLPPLAGFMSKWQIFVAGFATKDGWVMALVVFAALNSLLSLGYYAPLVNRIYRHEPGEAVKNGVKMPAVMAVPLVLLVAAIVVVGFMPSVFSWLTVPAGTSLMGLFGG